MKNQLLAFVSLGAIDTIKAAGAGSKWDYAKNGKDWGIEYPDCLLPNQSPIDLASEKSPGFLEYP